MYTVRGPKPVEEEYEVIYMNAVNSLMVGQPRKFWNPFSREQPNIGQ